jgi:hypothetical protein
VIYSIDGPQGGTWTVTANGSGQFLMDSLVTSNLAMNIIAPDAKSTVQPLGQPFTITAQLTDQGAVVTNGYELKATLQYAGAVGNGQAPYTQDITLSNAGGAGNYSATVTLPGDGSAPTGSYTLSVAATQTSNTPVVTAQRSLRFAIFPAPVLYDAQGHVADPAPGNVVQFDPVLQFLYKWPNGIVQWLSNGPLSGIPAQPSAVVPGQVLLQNKPYCNATVKGTAQRQGSSETVPITLRNANCGAFHVIFPSSAQGTYLISFQTAGSFKDSHGDFGPTTRHALLTFTPATWQQELRAWLWSLLYALELFVLLSFLRSRLLTNSANKGYYTIKGQGARTVALRQRSLYWAIMGRNIIPSRRAEMGGTGMTMRVDSTGKVQVRRAKWPWISGRDLWKDGRGNSLPASFATVDEVYYANPNSPHYLFNQGGRTAPGSGAPGGGLVGPTTQGRGLYTQPRAGAPSTAGRGPATRGGRPGAPPPRPGAPPPKR